MTDKEILIENIKKAVDMSVESGGHKACNEIMRLMLEHINIFSGGCPEIALAPVCAALELYSAVLRKNMTDELKTLCDLLKLSTETAGVAFRK